jgi:hypothetical protein
LLDTDIRAIKVAHRQMFGLAALGSLLVAPQRLQAPGSVALACYEPQVQRAQLLQHRPPIATGD